MTKVGSDLLIRRKRTRQPVGFWARVDLGGRVPLFLCGKQPLGPVVLLSLCFVPSFLDSVRSYCVRVRLLPHVWKQLVVVRFTGQQLV